jgi:hypothetical protein
MFPYSREKFRRLQLHFPKAKLCADTTQNYATPSSNPLGAIRDPQLDKSRLIPSFIEPSIKNCSRYTDFPQSLKSQGSR